MSGWGLTFVIIGIGSFLLNMMGMEFVLFMWVDAWGPVVGTAIRIGFIALGAVMMVVPRLMNRNS